LLGLLFLGLLPVLAISLERSLLIGVFDLDTGTSGMVVGFLLFFAAKGAAAGQAVNNAL
jgi:hypothetical protein